MAEIPNELGVQSFCFRHFKDNAKVAGLVRQCGLDRVELCRAHVDFDDTSSHQRIVDTFREAGVSIPSIGVERIDVGREKLKNILDFAHCSGATNISANFLPNATAEQLNEAAKMARDYGVRYGIHVHGGYHWLGNSQILDHVFACAQERGDERLGLCLDTAWALDAKQDPVEMAKRFGDRLFGVHIKDFVFDRAGKGSDVVVGTGNLDLPGLLRQMHEVGFNGSCVLEYEGDADDPVPALKRCVEAVKAA